MDFTGFPITSENNTSRPWSHPSSPRKTSKVLNQPPDSRPPLRDLCSKHTWTPIDNIQCISFWQSKESEILQVFFTSKIFMTLSHYYPLRSPLAFSVSFVRFKAWNLKLQRITRQPLAYLDGRWFTKFSYGLLSYNFWTYERHC